MSTPHSPPLLIARWQGAEHLDGSPVALELVLTDGDLVGELRRSDGLFLVLRGIEVGRSPGALDVFLPLASDSRSREPAGLRLARASFFGAANHRSEGGFDHVLDVTRHRTVLEDLVEGGPRSIRLTLAPVYEWGDAIDLAAVDLLARWSTEG